MLWFVFSIIRAGCFDGWMRISLLNEHDEGAAKFCIFLTVLEALGYLASMILGIICIIRISNVSFDFPQSFALGLRRALRE